jgi:hypothetical protein
VNSLWTTANDAEPPGVATGIPRREVTISRAVYAAKPPIPGWHGKVTCGVKIDDHGHVRDVHVEGTTDESVIKRIRAALIHWEYGPATTNGHPIARVRSSERGMT